MAQTLTAGRLFTAKSLTDRKVINKSGDRLGEIQDFVIDVTRGTISYAVLTYSGGFLNMNRKHFAVPWEAFIIDEAHRDLILDVNEDVLKDSPGFDRDEWPSEPDETFAQSVRDYYGYGDPTKQQQEMQGQGEQYQQETMGEDYGRGTQRSQEPYPVQGEPGERDSNRGDRW